VFTGPPGRLAAFGLFDSLEAPMATHYDIVQMQSAHSTQDVATDAFTSSGRPTLVVADRQLEGRGRHGRKWVQPDRALFSSFSFVSRWDQVDLPLLPLCAAVAVRRAIIDVAATTVSLKWPNDLLLVRKKTGGILVEASDQRVTVGCGLNLWWSEPPSFASAISQEDPGEALAAAIATAWVDALIDIAEHDPGEWPIDEYRNACVTLGSRVSWSSGVGVAENISENGHLLVATGDGTVTLSAGDVHLDDTPLPS
jgi:BirA family biotin operon repressor/biotin-[acetyl-CoA-carboxylase] ligase